MDKTGIKNGPQALTSRRDCLKIIGMLGLGMAVPSVWPTSSEAKLSNGLNQVSRTLPLMGTFVNITVLHPSQDKTVEAVEKGFSRMEELVKVFDRYSNSTPVSWLNHKGQLKDVCPDLALVMSKAAYFHFLSQGSFDVTIQPLVDLYKEAFARTGHAPSSEKVKEKLALVDADNIQFNKQGISFLKEGMGITLDGIAKGYIVDEAANTLKKIGIQYALINAGGDIRAIGGNGPNKSWKIGITDPRKQKPYLQTIALNNGAVATSGNYEVYFDREKLYHHIIDTHTGRSPRDMASVSITAPTVMEADALSTTVFVEGIEKGMQLVETLPNVEAMVIIASGNKKFASKGWKTT
ncbi:MAG: FAD:protein FMN transferase [Deltaproteobacteria bacterium]|nr:FAD:protein FMN transferase [Deltaproteobacteria bacterium]